MNYNSYFRIIGVFLVLVALMLFISVTYHNSHKRQEPIVFSGHGMLAALWNFHKSIYRDQANGRTFDKSRQSASTSESESYTLLRAVWWNDKTTYDRSWNWTKANLQHQQGDSLFSWYYGKMANGQYGVDAQNGGVNTAADADTDIALSLIFVHDRWTDASYLDEAKKVINGIWNSEVLTINGKPYILANNIEKTTSKQFLVVNPSYYAPYAYRIFAKYDPSHDWNGLVSTSYQILDASMTSSLDKKTSASLPPDWLTIDRNTASVAPANSADLDTNYSYDAMRIPFRLALDWIWNKDTRAQALLTKMTVRDNEWKGKSLLYATYAHDGSAVQNIESPSIYGGDIGYFIVQDPAFAAQIYANKLQILYTPDSDSWKKDLTYYDDAWAWLGMALYNNYLPNLDK